MNFVKILIAGLNSSSIHHFLLNGYSIFTFQVIDLKTQLSYYYKVESWLRQKLGNDEAKMTISRAVYLFSIGSNDYMSPFLTNSSILHNYSDSTYVGMVIGNLTTVIKVSNSSLSKIEVSSFRKKINMVCKVL